jgi:2'-5' RNA ligase
MLRTFIAVKIPATPSLADVVQELGRMGASVRPVATDNLHLTLKFLGDTPQSRIAEVVEVVSRAAGAANEFDLRLVGLGAFPHAQRPDVIWSGIDAPDVLRTLAEAFESELGSLGFRREAREFKPHLTLARVKAKPPPALFQLLADHPATDFGNVHVSAIEYLQSELQRGGPKYTVLALTRFGERGASAP